MLKTLKKLKKKALSNKDIIDNVKHNISFVTYPELENFNSLDDVFDDNKSILILYLQSPNFGHWTCLNKLGNNLIEFFDPYGILIDNELKFNSKELNDKLEQDAPFLSKLMIDSQYNLSYNEFSFQEEASNINTCGRHCIVRMNHLNLSLNQYKNVFSKLKKFLSPDDVVTIMTFDI